VLSQVVNMEMDLQEFVCVSVNWIHQIHDRKQWRFLVNTVMNLRVP